MRLRHSLATAFATAVVTTLSLSAPAHAGAAAAAGTVHLNALTCYETQDLGGDDLYLRVNGQTVWSAASTVECDHDAPVTVPVNWLAKTGDMVSLYDRNESGGGDEIGSDMVEADRGSLVFHRGDGGLYTLDYGPA